MDGNVSRWCLDWFNSGMLPLIWWMPMLPCHQQRVDLLSGALKWSFAMEIMCSKQTNWIFTLWIIALNHRSLAYTTMTFVPKTKRSRKTNNSRVSLSFSLAHWLKATMQNMYYTIQSNVFSLRIYRHIYTEENESVGFNMNLAVFVFLGRLNQNRETERQKFGKRKWESKECGGK